MYYLQYSNLIHNNKNRDFMRFVNLLLKIVCVCGANYIFNFLQKLLCRKVFKFYKLKLLISVATCYSSNNKLSRERVKLQSKTTEQT